MTDSKDLSERFIGKTLTKKQVEKNLEILSKGDTDLEKLVRLEGFIQGMEDLGAEYKSHNKHNIYFKLKADSQIADDNRKKRAKHTAFMMTGLLLRFTE